MRPACRMWPVRTFCEACNAFWEFLNKYVDKCLEKGHRKIFESNLNDYPVRFRPSHSNKGHISFSSNILRSLGSMLKTSSHALSTSRKHMTGFLLKNFGECCASAALTAACCWAPSHSILPQTCVRVGRVTSRPYTIGVRKGCVLSLLFFIVNISGSQPFR